jgi:flavin-binding protein dodecin
VAEEPRPSPAIAPGFFLRASHTINRTRTAFGRITMSDHIYKKIELTGSSSEGTDQAIRNAIAKAAQTVRNMRWFEVVETRGHIDDQKIAHWQVTIKVGFTLDE